MVKRMKRNGLDAFVLSPTIMTESLSRVKSGEEQRKEQHKIPSSRISLSHDTMYDRDCQESLLDGLGP